MTLGPLPRLGIMYSPQITYESDPQENNEDDEFLLKRANLEASKHPLLIFKPGMTLDEIRKQREAAAKHFLNESI